MKENYPTTKNMNICFVFFPKVIANKVEIQRKYITGIKGKTYSSFWFSNKFCFSKLKL